MLTPAKIKNHHFEAAGRNAYKADGVDRFFEEVAESYEQMFRENGDMYKKISLLAERLEEYRKDEDNIRNALLTAQRMAEQIQREAKEKADALLADAELRAKTENERIDAETSQLMAKATYQAKTLVEEAQKHAEKIVYDATYESKAAAISARDMMIKEEAALEMMKVEVTKFKKQILDSYNSQIALISELPELVYAAAEPEEEPEVEVEIVEEVIEAPVEETVEEAEEPVAVAVFEAVDEEPEAADEVDVDTLQQMIDEAVDTDAEDEAEAEEDEDIPEDTEFTGEVVLPEIDEESDVDLDKLVDRYTEEPVKEENGADVFFTKPKDDESKGFKVNIDKISSYNADEEESYLDDVDDEFDDDDDDDDSDGGIASKFKGFFKK